MIGKGEHRPHAQDSLFQRSKRNLRRRILRVAGSRDLGSPSSSSSPTGTTGAAMIIRSIQSYVAQESITVPWTSRHERILEWLRGNCPGLSIGGSVRSSEDKAADISSEPPHFPASRHGKQDGEVE